MLSEQIISLIRQEQKRQSGSLIDNVDFEHYIDKLSSKAEVFVNYNPNGCSGFVAYYCNDFDAKTGFITLVLVDPSFRGFGLGKLLVSSVINIMRSRGFVRCRLEVKKTNFVAKNLYKNLGFYEVNNTDAIKVIEKDILEINLCKPN